MLWSFQPCSSKLSPERPPLKAMPSLWGRNGRWHAAHAEACRSVGVSFNPLVVEYIGGWSDRATDTSFGRLLGQRLGISKAESATLLLQISFGEEMPQCGSSAHPSDQPRSMGCVNISSPFPCIKLTFFSLHYFYFVLSCFISLIFIVIAFFVIT